MARSGIRGIVALASCMLLAVALAWGERFVDTLDRGRLPKALGWLAGIWPRCGSRWKC